MASQLPMGDLTSLAMCGNLPVTPLLSDLERNARPLSKCKSVLASPGGHHSLTWSDCDRDLFRLGRSEAFAFPSSM